MRLPLKYIWLLAAGILLCSAGHTQDAKRLSLLFAGDIMGHDTQIASAKAQGDGSYDYSSCFAHIAPWIEEADIAVGNLEVTLAGAPYKGYPAFSSPDELAVELKRVGFDVMVHANNHAIDRRKKGLERTLSVLDSIGMIHTGDFRDTADRAYSYPLILEKNGIRLALLNYTYGTNGIKVTVPNIVNYIDTVQVKQDLKKAKLAKPDFVIALMHWGKEYQRSENSTQIRLAKMLYQNGVDAIIGSHPHVVQPIRIYPGNRLTVFSMGNMISNQRKRYTDGGILLMMTLEKSDSTYLSEHSYLPVWVHKPKNDKGTAFQLVPAAADSTVQKELRMSKAETEAMNIFLKDTRGNIDSSVEADWKKMRKDKGAPPGTPPY